ncbi:MAG: peptidylprolyl isomerase, partial [Flavobacterium sp.]|nr:peptidylprolyl isomerase [Flavobacterium sp.]
TEIKKTGISEVIEKNGYYFVIQVKNILPESEKTMAESKGKLISDYQQFLEKNWVDALKNEFKVIINQPVFDAIKKQM